MKALLMIVFLAACTCACLSDDYAVSTATNEPIIGGFGVKLGDVLTDDLAKQLKAVFVEKKQDGKFLVFFITPPKPFDKYAMYAIMITAKSKKIFGIGAKYICNNSDIETTFHSELHKLTVLALSKKYGEFEKGEFENGENLIKIYERTFPDRYILHGRKGGTQILEYVDKSIQKSEIDDSGI